MLHLGLIVIGAVLAGCTPAAPDSMQAHFENCSIVLTGYCLGREVDEYVITVDPAMRDLHAAADLITGTDKKDPTRGFVAVILFPEVDAEATIEKGDDGRCMYVGIDLGDCDPTRVVTVTHSYRTEFENVPDAVLVSGITISLIRGTKLPVGFVESLALPCGLGIHGELHCAADLGVCRRNAKLRGCEFVSDRRSR